MKRDMGLLRLLLLQLEGDEQATEQLQNYAEEQLVYHSVLLIEADLVDGQIVKNHVGVPVATTILKMTWKGHDFLDSIRDESTWKTVSGKIVSTGAAWSVELIKSLAMNEVRHRLGLPPS